MEVEMEDDETAWKNGEGRRGMTYQKPSQTSGEPTKLGHKLQIHKLLKCWSVTC